MRTLVPLGTWNNVPFTMVRPHLLRDANIPTAPEGSFPRRRGCGTRPISHFLPLARPLVSWPRLAVVRVVLQGYSLFSADHPSPWAWDQAGSPGAPGPGP